MFSCGRKRGLLIDCIFKKLFDWSKDCGCDRFEIFLLNVGTPAPGKAATTVPDIRSVNFNSSFK
jgi:hypothetical protein